MTIPEPQSGLLTLSPSRLMTYMQCPKKYELRHVKNTPEPKTGGMVIGSAVHRAIAIAEREKLWRSKDETYWDAKSGWVGRLLLEALVALHDEIDRAGGEALIAWGGRKSKKFPNGEDWTWAKHVMPMMLRAYCDVRAIMALRGFVDLAEPPPPPEHEKPVESSGSATEFYVSMSIETGGAEPLLVRGYIDKMVGVNTDTGDALIIDWKTGSMTDLVQLVSYAKMVMESIGYPVHKGWFVKLRPNAKQRIIEHDLDPLLNVVPDLYLAVKSGVDAGFFPIHPSSFCNTCGVRAACPWGSKLPEKELSDD
jgi:hypothetical protein